MENNGFKFVMEKALYKEAAPIKIDMSYMGFTIESNLALGGGSCSSGSCSSGSCSV